MYYSLTELNQVYAKTKQHDGSFTFGYLESKYKNQSTICRRTPFKKVSNIFTGAFNSDTFASKLLASIKANYTNDNYMVKDHLNHAFDAIFDEATQDWAHQSSREYFEDNRAYDEEYLKDGTVYDLMSEECA